MLLQPLCQHYPISAHVRIWPFTLLYSIHLHNKRPARRQTTSSRDDSQGQIDSHALPFLNNSDLPRRLLTRLASRVDNSLEQENNNGT